MRNYSHFSLLDSNLLHLPLECPPYFINIKLFKFLLKYTYIKIISFLFFFSCASFLGEERILKNFDYTIILFCKNYTYILLMRYPTNFWYGYGNCIAIKISVMTQYILQERWSLSNILGRVLLFIYISVPTNDDVKAIYLPSLW